MAGGGFVQVSSAHKIKGGRWTVFRFFLVSVAFTSAWVAVSSQLGYYRTLHGPAVLLQLNIAYFLPSIPLLVVSAFLDKPLEERLGVPKTILVRLLVGLVGYAAVTAWFPFMPTHIWFLLGAVVALGLFSGIAFSASYQLVARFANKNVIALGLGCSASGPLVLAMQLALEMGPRPTRKQQIILYEVIALVIAAGLWATVSLLVRHWASIERASGKQDLTEPLLQQQQQQVQLESASLAAGASPPGTPTAAARAAAAAEDGTVGTPPPASPFGDGQPLSPLTLGQQLWQQRSLPLLVGYSSLEPFESPFISTEQEVGTVTASSSWDGPSSLSLAAGFGDEETAQPGSRGRGAGQGQLRSERQQSAPPAVLASAVVPEAVGASLAQPTFKVSVTHAGPGLAGLPEAAQAQGGRQQILVATGPLAGAAGAGAAAAGSGAAGRSGVSEGSLSWQALKLVWAPVAALSLSSTVALTLFPFFTYVPTSGLLGESLPKALFFVRIFADVVGRFLPRLSLFAAQSPITPLAAAGVKLAGVPLFLLYLKSPDHLHSDVAAVTFIAMIWMLGGYINTMSNMLAPRLAPPQLKGAAAGVMAIAYQAAHFLGLSVATLLVFLMYGHIGVA